MADSIEVEVVFRSDRLEPRAFRYRGRLLQVLDLGRHWQQDDEIHWLVRTSDRRVFELIHQRSEGYWRLGSTPADYKGRGPAA
jgi:hypothetical protein